MSKISIACIALWKKKVLIAFRNPTGQMGNRWEFPGGKVEDGENEEEGIVREFFEEFGVRVKVGKKICEDEFFHGDEKRFLHAYEIFVPHKGIFKKYKLTEHTQYKWATFDEIKNLKFVDSDFKIYEKVREFAESR